MERGREGDGTMNRRELLATGASFAALAGCGPQQAAAPAAQSSATAAPTGDPFSAQKLMADVEAYVGFGTHRTGSPGDVATSDWFAGRWKSLGYEIEHTEFPTPNADTSVARIEGGSQAIDGFAQPPLSFTPATGVSAPLVAWNPKAARDAQGKIAVVHIPRAPGGVVAMA